MKILITGATGLIGSKLLESLIMNGHDDIRILTRNKNKAKKRFSFPIEYFQWDILSKTIDPGALNNVDVVFHLAGENVADGRWSEKRKKELISSRIESSKMLIEAIKKESRPPQKFITASAIGIYGNRGDEKLDTHSKRGSGFLAELCQKWESIAFNHGVEGMSAYALRIGVVLSTQGGALKKMLPAFKAGVAGQLGSGKQFMSWIHIEDLIGQFIFLMENELKQNVYNGVAPNPVTNLAFTKTLGKTISRPTLFPVPSFALKLLFGDMSEILLGGQKVIPANFTEQGYSWKFSTLEEAFLDLFKYDNNGEELLVKYQWVNHDLEKVFDFFSDEKNLEKITPPFLNFSVLDKDTPDIECGTTINYQLKIYGFPLKWISKIKKFERKSHFVDEQVKGPYAKWVHTHNFNPLKSGTLITDEIVYKVPFGLVGKFFGGYLVRKDLNKIFNFRQEKIYHLFSQHC